MTDARWWVSLLTVLLAWGCADIDAKDGDPWGIGEQDPAPTEVDENLVDENLVDENLIDPDVVPEPDPADPPDPPDPPDMEPIDAAELVGSRWGSMLEGSVGTYVTWRELAAEGVLDVVEETHQWDASPPEVTWSNVGEWSVDEAVVSMSWAHVEYEATYEEQRTWAVVSGDLATTMQPWTPGIATEGVRLWLAGGLRRVAANTYRGVWQSKQFYGEYRTLRRVETTIHHTPSPCTVSIELAVSHEQSGELEEGVELFDFVCRTDPMGDDGWTQIYLEGFDDDLANSWNELLTERDVLGRVGYQAQRLMASHFLPRLYLDPSGDLLIHQSSSEVLFDAFQRPGEF